MTFRNNDIANELRELVPGALWPGLVPSNGEVPAGYFEQFPAQILQKVLAADALQNDITAGEQDPGMLSSLLTEVPKNYPLSAPADYFNQLPAQIMQKIRAAEVQEELETLSALLAEAPKTCPLSVPTDYFDQLSTNIIANITIPVAEIPSRHIKLRRRYIKWAAAASLLAVMGSSSLFFIRENHRAYKALEASLADVSDQEIMEYLQSHVDVFDKEELANYAPLMEGSNPDPAVEELPAEVIQHSLDNTGLLKKSITDN
jgi:hypothetical protein